MKEPEGNEPISTPPEVEVESSDIVWPTRQASVAVAPGSKAMRKGIAQEARAISEEGRDILYFWKRVMDGLEPRATMRDRMEASKLLMERAHGKAPEVSMLVNLDAQEGRQATATLDLDTLERLAALLTE